LQPREEAAGFKLQASSSSLLTLSFKFQVPSRRLQASSFRLQVPSFRDLVIKTILLETPRARGWPKGEVVRWHEREASFGLDFFWSFLHCLRGAASAKAGQGKKRTKRRN